VLRAHGGVLINLMPLPGEASTMRTMVVIGKPGNGRNVDNGG